MRAPNAPTRVVAMPIVYFARCWKVGILRTIGINYWPRHVQIATGYTYQRCLTLTRKWVLLVTKSVAIWHHEAPSE